jgi:hypothetical protein
VLLHIRFEPVGASLLRDVPDFASFAPASAKIRSGLDPNLILYPGATSDFTEQSARSTFLTARAFLLR